MDINHVMKENDSHVEGGMHKAISCSVRTERPGNYLFKIESFSLLLKALTETKQDKYDSLCFSAGGYKWKLSLYPNGDKKRGGDGYISLYLVFAEHKSWLKGEEVHSFINFFVYDHLRDNYLVLQDGKERRFHALKTESGLVKMLSLEIFNDPSQGYLVDDCCAFGVEIFLNKIERQGGLSLSKNNLSATESTFTWRIKKFSTLPKLYESDVFELGGLEWTLQLHPRGYSKGKGKCLSLFLCIHVPSFPCGWNIYAKYKLSIMDQLNHIHHEEIDDEDWFSTDVSPGWGYSLFIQLSDLNDPSRGLIVNDTITVQVKFKCISFIKSLT